MAPPVGQDSLSDLVRAAAKRKGIVLPGGAAGPAGCGSTSRLAGSKRKTRLLDKENEPQHEAKHHPQHVARHEAKHHRQHAARHEAKHHQINDSKLNSQHDDACAWVAEALGDKFTVLGYVGHGSFGMVYRALAHCMNGEGPADVVLKCHLPSVQLNSITKEAAYLHQLGGQNNVVKLLGGGIVGVHRYFVLPYVKRNDFKYITETAELTDVKRYLHDLFTALAHVHSHNIIHRDVKPSNFLFSLEEKRGYLVDFGLAEELRDRHVASTLEGMTREGHAGATTEAIRGDEKRKGMAASRVTSTSGLPTCSLTTTRSRITTICLPTFSFPTVM
eukprot:jgi/Mesvir1/11721/Mv00103-RA.2